MTLWMPFFAGFLALASHVLHMAASFGCNDDDDKIMLHIIAAVFALMSIFMLVAAVKGLS